MSSTPAVVVAEASTDVFVVDLSGRTVSLEEKSLFTAFAAESILKILKLNVLK